MTADVEMLPELVDEGLDFFNLAGDEGDKLYVSAIRQHIAAKDAEVEALRAEVERLTFEMGRLRQQYDERTACMIVHRGSALACSDAVRAAYSEEHHRAERLAEALRWAERHCPCGARPESPDTHPHVPGCLVGAALAQEDRND